MGLYFPDTVRPKGGPCPLRQDVPFRGPYCPIYNACRGDACPAIDLDEPIIYCADCAYCVKTDQYERWCHGFCNPPRLVAPDDFCSHGKRAE